MRIIGTVLNELREAEVTLERSIFIVHGSVHLEIFQAIKGLAATFLVTGEFPSIRVLLLMPAELTGSREGPVAALEGARIRLESSVRAHVSFQTARVIERFAAAWPVAGEVRILVGMGSSMRHEGACSVVSLAAAVVVTGVRGKGIVMYLHVNLEIPFHLKFLVAAGHLAGCYVWPCVHFFMNR